VAKRKITGQNWNSPAGVQKLFKARKAGFVKLKNWKNPVDLKKISKPRKTNRSRALGHRNIWKPRKFLHFTYF
jgi:hypothetical protein